MSAYWNYADALAYALTLYKPEGTDRFTADPPRWHQAILDIKTEFGGTLPDVFDDIFFDIRHGRAPYSAEVDHFLHTLAQAQLMSEANPAYEVLQLTQKQKEALIRLNKERLGTIKAQLEEVGKKLGAALTIPE